MNFIDFFAGIGGFRRGMELAGHHCVGFCEYDPFAIASYTSMHLLTDQQREFLQNFPLRKRQKEILKEEYRNGEWFSNDIRKIWAGDLPAADCWCFGFPCQDISISGTRKGFSGNRSSLFFRVMYLLGQLEEKDKPTYLFIENVRNLLSVTKGWDFARVLIELDKAGYDAQWQTVNSKDYGVPHSRTRVFIIGYLRTRSPREVLPICRKNKSTIKQVIGGGQGKRVYDISGLAPTLTANGGGWGAKTGLYLIDLSTNNPKITNYARYLTTKYNNGLSNRIADKSGVLETETDRHNYRIRRLTPKECFRLQGWPDEYFDRAKFVNSDNQLYKQAGNGVTVPVIQEIAKKFEI